MEQCLASDEGIIIIFLLKHPLFPNTFKNLISYMYILEQNIPSSSLKQWFSTGVSFAALKTFFDIVVITWGGGACSWHVMVAVRASAKHTTGHRTAPLAQTPLAPNFNTPRLRNHGLEGACLSHNRLFWATKGEKHIPPLRVLEKPALLF